MKKYILELLILVNKYYLYDNIYVSNKYQIMNEIEFDKTLQKNQNILLFNSLRSEILFIHILNVDNNYIYKYKKSFYDLLSSFFIDKKKYHFSHCHKISSKTKSLHLDNCYCKIKVKSIANLKIDTFIEIYKNETSNTNQYINKTDAIKNYINKLENLNKNIKLTNKNIVFPEKKIVNPNTKNFQLDSEIGDELEDYFNDLIGNKVTKKHKPIVEKEKINIIPEEVELSYEKNDKINISTDNSISSVINKNNKTSNDINNYKIDNNHKNDSNHFIKKTIKDKNKSDSIINDKSDSLLKDNSHSFVKDNSHSFIKDNSHSFVKDNSHSFVKDKSESIEEFIKDTTETYQNTDEIESLKSNNIFKKNESELLIKNKDDEIKKKKMIMLLKLNKK
jgi:hypothetical protein